jgi:hypothetical protein
MTKLLPVCQLNPTKNKTYQVQFCRCKGLRWSMKVGCHSKFPSRHQTFVCVLSRRSHTRRGSPQRCWDGSGRTTSFLGPQVILWGQCLWIDNAPTLTGLHNWWCSQKLWEYLYGSLLLQSPLLELLQQQRHHTVAMSYHDPTLLISALCLLMRLQPLSFLDQERMVVDPEPEDLEILHYTE